MTDDIAKVLERLRQAKAELAAVDARLARRPALDDLSSRADKVERACSVASKADAALARAEKAEARAEKADAEREEARAQCVRLTSDLVNEARHREKAERERDEAIAVLSQLRSGRPDVTPDA